MTQVSLPFDQLAPALRAVSHAMAPPAAGQQASDPVAFGIGWDHARHRITPAPAHLHAANPVHQGWRAGRSAFGLRTLRATPAIRRWLGLRLAAWQNGQPFEDVQVTPHFLRQIEVACCPVSRRALDANDTGDSPAPDAAVVDRAHTGAAWAGGNLVMLSARVRHARAGRGWDEAIALSQRIADGESEHIDGLDGDEWRRLGVLASLATPLPHALAASLPLVVLPPNRLRVINPVQALQVMLTLQFGQAGYARRLVTLASWMPCTETRAAFRIFMHTLLARRLALPPLADAITQRRGMEDSWTDALVQRRWQRLALRLSAADCEQLLERASMRGLAGRGATWISADRATDGWALDAARPGQAAATFRLGSDAVPEPTPGSTRSKGSQKAASCAAVTDCGAFQ